MAVVDPEKFAEVSERTRRMMEESAKAPGAEGAYGRLGPVGLAFDEWQRGEVERETPEADVLNAGIQALGAMISSLAGTNGITDLPGLIHLMTGVLTRAAECHQMHDDDETGIVIHAGRRQ
jgi:hypothetical protein